MITSINKIFYGNDDESNINLEAFLNLPNNQHSTDNLEKLKQAPLIPSFFFESRRDVKKFFNELFINIRTLKNIEDIELEEYILLKLLLFRYKWIHKNFTSKRMEFWLGNDITLKFEHSNLNELIINPEVENHDRIIIFSVLKNLFPSTGINNNSNSINQKRYFPIYFGNNVFNESFSFSELIRALEEITIENLINNRVLGKPNEDLIKDDIKKFVLKRENIKSIDEYKQAIALIKNNLVGFVNEVEILDFIHLGEENFEDNYNQILDMIFTNFQDSFGIFMYELSIHYSKIPADVSLSRQNNIGSYLNSRKISDFKILNKNKLLSIMLKIVLHEIEKNKNDFNKVFQFFDFFYEVYYPYFHFRLFFDEIKPIIKDYLEENFEIIFLSESVMKNIANNIDTLFIATVFEDATEREKIIKEAKSLIEGRSNWLSSDLDSTEYEIKGMDNFVIFVENLKDKIDLGKISEYNDFLNWFHLDLNSKKNIL